MDLAPLAETAAQPLICARKRFGLPALCGKAGGMWTTSRVAVTCRACREEIARRLEVRSSKARSLPRI